MKNLDATRKLFCLLSICLFLTPFVNGCDLFQPQTTIELPEPNTAKNPPEEEEVDVVPLEKPLVIPDYSKYSAITDPGYYENQYLGEIFIIKEWKVSTPQENILTVYGKIPFTVHPNQSLTALDFADSNQPVILTGFGKGWGKVVTKCEGHGAVSGQSADISVICTGEVNAEFKLVGGFYPSPTCVLDVDILTIYYPETSVVTCVYNNGMELPLPMDAYLDLFTDIKLPISFHLPDIYRTRFAQTDQIVTYDLSYYLYNFWGSAPSEEELALTLGSQPYQFYETGCPSVHLGFDTAFIPEGSEMLENPPSSWEIMLTPESERSP